jgi:hypothetical protein
MKTMTRRAALASVCFSSLALVAFGASAQSHSSGGHSGGGGGHSGGGAGRPPGKGGPKAGGGHDKPGGEDDTEHSHDDTDSDHDDTDHDSDAGSDHAEGKKGPKYQGGRGETTSAARGHGRSLEDRILKTH